MIQQSIIESMQFSQTQLGICKKSYKPIAADCIWLLFDRMNHFYFVAGLDQLNMLRIFCSTPSLLYLCCAPMSWIFLTYIISWLYYWSIYHSPDRSIDLYQPKSISNKYSYGLSKYFKGEIFHRIMAPFDHAVKLQKWQVQPRNIYRIHNYSYEVSVYRTFFYT